jgi:hypothetical protein
MTCPHKLVKRENSCEQGAYSRTTEKERIGRADCSRHAGSPWPGSSRMSPCAWFRQLGYIGNTSLGVVQAKEQGSKRRTGVTGQNESRDIRPVVLAAGRVTVLQEGRAAATGRALPDDSGGQLGFCLRFSVHAGTGVEHRSTAFHIAAPLNADSPRCEWASSTPMLRSQLCADGHRVRGQPLEGCGWGRRSLCMADEPPG